MYVRKISLDDKTNCKVQHRRETSVIDSLVVGRGQAQGRALFDTYLQVNHESGGVYTSARSCQIGDRKEP